MKRETARRIHDVTNTMYWAENPEWVSDDKVQRALCRGIRALPFSIHEIQKKLFFDMTKVIAVNGETVVAAGEIGDTVDKFMFRYPGDMGTDEFKQRVSHEVGAVTRCLAGIALDTQVSVKPARVFRRAGVSVDAVAQTQERLDLGIHGALRLADVEAEAPSARKDQTARDLEQMLRGMEPLLLDHDYYPDLAENSGNVRRSVIDGSVTLIDVMPIYGDGGRLIADGAVMLPGALDNMQRCQDFVGQYGA